VVDLLIEAIDDLNESEVFVIEGFPKNLSNFNEKKGNITTWNRKM